MGEFDAVTYLYMKEEAGAQAEAEAGAWGDNHVFPAVARTRTSLVW